LTPQRRSSILEVVHLSHGLTTVLLCLGLIAGNAGICAGWAATPEERMACCEEGRNCPMHTRETDDSGSGKVLTQADADSCCLVSEGRKSSDTQVPTFAAALSFAVMGPGVVLPASVPALVVSDGWRMVLPIPTTPVPRHVLLSVFLV
jgi:hypothetical protein